MRQFFVKVGNMDAKKLMAEVLELESRALNIARERLDQEMIERLTALFQNLLSCGGSLGLCGVGKSGLIAQKISSTFSSLGLRSYFLHPTEALHGDLGRVGADDAMVFISKSGTTEEICKLFPYLDIPKERRIGLLGAMASPMGRECGIVFDCSVEKEACLNNQAPTTSSTLALAMGDAMAVLFEAVTGLSKEKFAINHPGGLLGKSLRVKVKDLLWPPEQCPVVSPEQSLQDVILLMTKFPVGGCAVCDHRGSFLGMIVEGDIRRSFGRLGPKALETKVEEIMNPSPVMVTGGHLALDALKLMENREREIHILPVVEKNNFHGLIRLHDLLKEGFLLEKK